MQQEIIKKAGEIIGQNTVHNAPDGPEPYCVLALLDEEGFPTASTLTASRAEGINWIAFCTGLKSKKAQRIANSNRASVCFNKDGAYNITLVGTIEVLTDPETKREMWYPGMGNLFRDAEDPEYCVLRFHTQRYSLFINWQEMAGTL